MKQFLKSRRVVTPEGTRPACIAIEEGRIASIDAFERQSSGYLDFGDLCILPGLVDTHVHMNEPGRTDWEGFATGTRAAAAGGFTCIVDMPLNSVPATTTVVALEQKRQAARDSCAVDYAFWGGVVPENESDLQPLAQAGVRGYKCFLIESGVDEFTCVTEQDLELAMPILANIGLPLLVHAELSGPVSAAINEMVPGRPDWSLHTTHLRSRPDEAEIQAVKMMIRLCRKHGCRLHIVHLSSALCLPLLARARSQGLPITVETCPHYLHFCDEHVPPRATQYKCAPPIRNAANREQLWEALRDRLIDMIATDHSPCPPELKGASGDFSRAWGGIASLSLALPVVWTEAAQRGFSLDDVVRWMSENTAALAGLEAHKGRIALGYDADLVVFDPDAQFTVTPDRLHFRHPVSPYLGETLQGEVQMTILHGRTIYARGKFIDDQSGTEAGYSK